MADEEITQDVKVEALPSTLSELAESAVKKSEEKKENARELCRDMFEKVVDFVNGELTSKCFNYAKISLTISALLYGSYTLITCYPKFDKFDKFKNVTGI